MNTAKRMINSFLGLNGLRQTGEAQKYMAAQVKEFNKQASNNPDAPLEDKFVSSAKKTAKKGKPEFVVLTGKKTQ